MSHEEDGRLMAYLDGELDPADAGAVQSHLGTCADCASSASRLQGERTRVRAVLPGMDVDASAAARRVRDRLAREAPLTAPSRTPSRTSHPAVRPSWLRRSRVLQAALFVLFVAGGASAVVPGSPLRRWLEGGPGAAPEAATPALMLEAPEAAKTTPSAEPMSLGALPVAGRLRVSLDVPAGTELVVAFVEGEQATVSAGVASFRGAEGLLEAAVTSGPVRVDLPRGGADISLEVGGQLYLRMQNGQVAFRAPGADSADARFTFRIP